MNEKDRPDEGVTTTPSSSSKPLENAIVRQPGGASPPPSIGQDSEPREFVLTVTHSQTGRCFSPFIVRAKDEDAARKLCRRNYLEIKSIELFVEVDGKKKPRTLAFGPPISDTDFEEDYGNRDADPSGKTKTPYFLGALGWFLCGPIGALLGYWVGSPSEGPQKRD